MRRILKPISCRVSGASLHQNTLVDLQTFENGFLKESIEANPSPDQRSFILLLENRLAQRHAEASFNVTQLADVMALCPRTLHRKTVALLALNPTRLLRLYRLSKAVILLQQGNLVSDTAFAVGFDNLSYFSKCFQREFQEHPSYYRNRMCLETNQVV